MGRRHNPEKLIKIFRAVRENPGHRPGLIARLIGIHRSDVLRALPALEEHGLYLCEDEHGCLWVYDASRRRKKDGEP